MITSLPQSGAGTVNNLTKMFTLSRSKLCSLNKFVPNYLKNVNDVKSAS